MTSLDPLDLSRPPIRARLQVAHKLLDLRYELRQTQAEFAWHFGLSREAYARWERTGPKTRQGVLLARLMLRRLGDRERWRKWKRRQRAAARAQKLAQAQAGGADQ